MKRLGRWLIQPVEVQLWWLLLVVGSALVHLSYQVAGWLS